MGTPAAAITSLAKALLPFQPRGRGRRAEARDPGGPDRIGHPGDERGLRADDHQIDPEPGGEARHRRSVQQVDGVIRGDLRRCPGLPGAACTSVTAGSWARASARACSRPPEPITSTRRGWTTCRKPTQGSIDGRVSARAATPASRPCTSGRGSAG